MPLVFHTRNCCSSHTSRHLHHLPSSPSTSFSCALYLDFNLLQLFSIFSRPPLPPRNITSSSPAVAFCSRFTCSSRIFDFKSSPLFRHQRTSFTTHLHNITFFDWLSHTSYSQLFKYFLSPISPPSLTSTTQIFYLPPRTLSLPSSRAIVVSAAVACS